MPEKKQKNASTSLRTPQPKKLGLAVPPLLRLPHEELIRAQEDQDERTRAGRSKDDPTRHADSASLATLDGAKTASLAETDPLGLQIASLANPARLANPPGLAGQPSTISLMDSLPDTTGFTKLHHQIVDHLYCHLSAKEQVVHIQLYRLAWGKGRPNCFINLPKLARRSNLSQRSVGEAVALLESKGLIRKGSVVTGRGKEQGIEYWITPAPALEKTASLANPASLATSPSLAKSGGRIEYKEELHEEHTHKEPCVGVSSKFTPEECRRYAEHLHRTGQGITNPGGYATAIHRTGEADSLIEGFLNPLPSPDLSKCPDCEGRGYKLAVRDGREGVVKCAHELLE
jgi:Helix-turn-helix domain